MEYRGGRTSGLRASLGQVSNTKDGSVTLVVAGMCNSNIVIILVMEFDHGIITDLCCGLVIELSQSSMS